MLKQRVITAVIALVIFSLVVFVAPPIVAELAIALVILAGAWEWSGFLGGASMPRRIAYVLFIALFPGLARADRRGQFYTPKLLASKIGTDVCCPDDE